MALTRGAWTCTTVNKMAVWTCTVTATTGESDIYTLKTPAELDGSKKWTLFVNTASAELDGTVANMPVDIYGGFSDNFTIGTGGAIALVDGCLLIADVIADVRTAVGTYTFDPENTAAAAKCPYYGILIDGASAVSAGDCTFKIVQGK